MYDLKGNGAKTLVFLHGFAGASEMWRQQVDELSSSNQCLSVDLPGHGANRSFELKWPNVAPQILEVLYKEKISQAHFVMSSLGGLVGLELWRQQPFVVSAFTFTGSLPRFTEADGFPAGLNIPKIRKLAGQFDGDVATVLDLFYRSLFTVKERASAQYAVVKDIRETMALPDRKALLTMLDVLEQADMRKALTEVSVPVQFINGDGDYICPLPAIEALRKLMPSARIDVVKNCGHFPFLTYPKMFNRLLRKFGGL